ncbi:acyltransferase family protein [Fuscibacter oryzae]|nr:acyltransferase family protein [Fuscibacter oryzae]
MRPLSPRLHHLDALRSAAILYGVLVHTATLGVTWPLTLISDISGYFRMGTFFLVSGFFGAMVLQRFGTAAFLKKRALALLVPLACGLLFLNPVTNWLVWNWHNPPLPLQDFLRQAWAGSLPFPRNGPMVWHLHLWFLISLTFYALMAPVAVTLARRLGRVVVPLGDRLAQLPGWLCVMLTAVFLALTSLGLRGFYEIALERILPHDGWNIPWLVRTTFYYWPMFLTGMAVFHHPGFAARFQAVSLPALALGATAVIFTRETMVQDGMLWEVVQLLTRAFLTVSAIAALMAVFGRWFSQPGFLSRSADAVYSIYILHFLLIYLIASALKPFDLHEVPRFLLVAGLTIVGLFALHRFVIKPSALLSLMFNGKPLSSRKR